MTMTQLRATLAAATALAAIGALGMPAVAQAHPLLPPPLAPACSAYQFPGGTVQINYLAINGNTTFDTVNASTDVDTTAVTHYHDGGDVSGPVTGYIHGVGIHQLPAFDPRWTGQSRRQGDRHSPFQWSKTKLGVQ
jgi:hypothetical protein